MDLDLTNFFIWVPTTYLKLNKRVVIDIIIPSQLIWIIFKETPKQHNNKRDSKSNQGSVGVL